MLRCLVILVVISGYYCADESPIVETPLGSVQGHTGKSFNGRKYLAFEGIPYAKPPIGQKRFEEPEPIDPWDEVLNATAITYCVSVFSSMPGYYMGEEDCLHVNVYIPREEINPEEKLEVLVFIHGGAFSTGSGDMLSNPTYVTDKEVIYVNFNYRLGPYGFLSTEDEVVPGNNGLKDQVLALKWVKQNIESFGGNPDSITVFGISAGSTSLHLHYLSDQSKDLFHRGLCQSGSALNYFATVEGNLERAEKLAKAFDCPVDTTRNMIDCLKEVPFDEIALKMDIFTEYKILPMVPFGPVVEKAGDNPFISEYPYILLKNGKVQDIPLVFSNVLHEGLVAVGAFTKDDLTDIDENWDLAASYLYDFRYTLPNSSWTEVAQKIREHYLGDKPVFDSENSLNFIQSVSERWFTYDGETAVKLQASVTESPVYYYIFAYPGDSAEIVPHGAEITYMFGQGGPPLTENELKMKDLLWDMLVGYAKTGTPSFGDIEWKPTTYEEDVYLYVSGPNSDNIEPLTATELTDRNFWTSLDFEENEHLVD